MGLLYDVSTTAVVAFCLVLQAAAIPVFIVVTRRVGRRAACTAQ